MSAGAFKDMAALIEHNGPERFAGAIVVVPPGEGAVPISQLLLAGNADIVQFWATVKNLIEVRGAEALQNASESTNLRWR